MTETETATGQRYDPLAETGLQGRRLPGHRLRRLAGVDEDVLSQIPSQAPRYTALGGIVLGTASLASFSMMLFLGQILGRFSPWQVPAALGWGLFVLTLDRWLVATGMAAKWSARLGVLLPRLVLAIIFGIIIAEPLVLRAFETAITKHIRDERRTEIQTYEEVLRSCNPSDPDAELPEGDTCDDATIVLADIVRSDATVRLDTLREERDVLLVQIAAIDGEIDRLNEAANRECNGQGAPEDGFTGRAGEGINCDERRRIAADYAATHPTEALNTELADRNEEIRVLEEEAGVDSETYDQALAKEIAARVDERRGQQGAIGLLERFGTLEELSSENGFLRAARWMLTLFLITIDCLPVLVKLMTGTTAYERMVGQLQAGAESVFDAEVDTAVRRRVEPLLTERRRLDAQAAFYMERDEVQARLRAAKTQADVQLQIDDMVAERLRRRAASAGAEDHRPLDPMGVPGP